MRPHLFTLTVAVSSFLLSSCHSKDQEAETWLTPERASAQYGVRISPLKIEAGKIVGTVQNTSSHGYKSADLLVHIYDPQGRRLKEQMVQIENLWVGEALRVNETVLYMTAAEQKGATAEVKAINVHQTSY